MKKMTCKQLAGACDHEFQGETFEELVEQSKAHGKEMFEKGDEAHMAVMTEMSEKMKDPEAMQKMFNNIKAEFEALPEL